MARKRKTVRDLLAAIDADESPEGLDLTLLSDLGESDLAEVEARWPDWPVRLRRSLLTALGEIARDNFRVNFDAVARLGVDDPDAEARTAAVADLWDSEDVELIAIFIRVMLNDPAVAARSEAAKNLGRFVYMGECGDLLPVQARRAEDALLAVIAGTDHLEVRRRAVESVAYSSRPEIIPIIEAAYRAPDEDMRVSALFAMGRNLDERWNQPVLDELHSSRAEIRFEAARAAGELGLESAVARLTEMTNELDAEAQAAAIWSLGEIGGSQAQAALRRRRRTAFAELREAIDEALANADLENLGFGLLEASHTDGGEDRTRVN